MRFIAPMTKQYVSYSSSEPVFVFYLPSQLAQIFLSGFEILAPNERQALVVT
jgi:hypothetical protein